MKRWLLLFSTILAVGFTADEARAKVPSFVRPGLVAIYVGYVGQPDNIDPFPQGLTPSTQKITVKSVTSNSVSGKTELTNFLVPPTNNQGASSTVKPGSTTVSWVCIENQGCTIDPPQLGAIAQFWVNPTNSIGSIFTPEGASYTQYMGPNPTAVSRPPPALAMTCPATIGNVTCIVYDKLVPPGLPNGPGPGQPPPPPATECKECLLLAFDSTGLVQYDVQWFEPLATLSGDVGELIYNLRSIIEPVQWQSDGTSIFLQDAPGNFLQDATGNIVISQLKGTNVVGGGTLTSPGDSWHVQAYADFNGDGKLDILWQSDSGQIVIWFTNETTSIGAVSVGNIDPSWHIKGTGDFNGDGKSDILFQNDNGDVAIWFINETGYAGGVNVGYGGSYRAVGTGDFNGDGKSDVLFQDDNGDVAIWFINSTGYIGGGYVGYAANYRALGTADFYGNGLCDILFQNDNGDVAIWEINSTRYIGGGYVGNAAGWQIIGVGDYNSDHRSDILFQNSSSGDPYIWEMYGTTAIGAGSIIK